MKRHFLITLLGLLPLGLFAQSTEGTDFWVTLMRSADNNPTTLSLTVSAKEASHVVVENAVTGYHEEFDLAAGGIHKFDAIAKQHCYVGDDDEEKVTDKALHITATSNISLVAANYRDKSFDVAAVLPTKALLDEYRIQCYTPSDHDDKPQGTQFAIVATEDNTVVKIVPTERLLGVNKAFEKLQGGYILTPEDSLMLNWQIGDTVTTPVLNKGQVYYVWTGNGGGNSYDLSGTYVKAENGKKIAVFNGNSHTNIPKKIRDRDHIYSQAMPTAYWGTKFAVMSSLTTRDNVAGLAERVDKVRVQALEDGTELYVNGQLVHTFDFNSTDNDDRKHFYEFEFGTFTYAQTDPDRPGIQRIHATSCWIETSCPAAVHQFLVSNQYDYPKQSAGGPDNNYCNGDPSELWVNPIEQGIDTITFGTFQTTQVQDHFLNIVTATSNVASMMMDGGSIAGNFSPLNGNAAYSFARFQINNGTHTLTADSGFIANVYGFGEKESYSYPAGAYTKDLSQSITINGQVFRPGEHNVLCGKDTIHFACQLNYDYESITWDFGDGSPKIKGHGDSVEVVDHYYPRLGRYPAYVLIQRKGNEGCASRQPVDSIAIDVNINHFVFSVGTPTVDCEGSRLIIPFENPNHIDLDGDNVELDFDNVAKRDGFTRQSLTIGESDFYIAIPATAQDGVQYGLELRIANPCGSVDTSFTFSYNKDILVQRFDRILGLKQSFLDNTYPGQQVSEFIWTKNGDVISNEPVLSLPSVADTTDVYALTFTIGGETVTACPVRFDAKHVENINITTLAPAGSPIRVKTPAAAEATWITIDGRVYGVENLSKGVNYIIAPRQAGIYVLLLRGDMNTSHKIIVK